MFRIGVVTVFSCALFAYTVKASGQGSSLALTTVVLTGQPAPNSNGAQFTGLSRPSINRNGVIAFRAELTSSPVSYGPIQGKLVPDGLFIASNKSITRLVGYGDSAPGTALTFTNVGDPVVNDQGDVAFVARIGSGFSNQRIYLHTSTSFVTVAQAEATAPGTNGAFVNLGRHGVAMNQAGTIVFDASFSGPSAGDGVFSYTNGKISPIALHGQSLPGAPGQVLDRVQGFAINDSGQIVFSGLLTNAAGVAGSGVFVASPSGNISLLYASNESAASATNGYAEVTEPSINSFGDIAFVEQTHYFARGRLSSPHSISIVAAGATSVLTAARKPTNPGDPIINGNFRRPFIVRGSDGTNTVLFLASSSFPNRNALWLYQHGALAPLVTEGDGSGNGGVLSFIGQASISPAGHIVFVSNLEGVSAGAGIFVTKLKL